MPACSVPDSMTRGVFLKKVIFCLLAVTIMCCGCGTSVKDSGSSVTNVSSGQTTSAETVADKSTSATSDTADSSDSVTESELEKEEYAGSTEIVLSDNETGGFN